MKLSLLTGLAATAMMMMAAPTDGSPIIVFDDDRRECARPVLMWIDPWLLLALDPELSDECDEAGSDPAGLGSRGGPGALGRGVGAAAWAGAFLMRAPRPIASPAWWLPPPVILLSGAAPPIDTFPVRETPIVDLFEQLWVTDHLGRLSLVEAEFVSTVASDPHAVNITGPATNPAVVPEPASLLLFATGLGAVAWKSRNGRLRSPRA